jgi:hypothetical protein
VACFCTAFLLKVFAIYLHLSTFIHGLPKITRHTWRVAKVRHIRKVGSMERQNKWIFKQAAFAAFSPPAFKYGLFSIFWGIKKAYFSIDRIPQITKSKNVEQQVMNLMSGIFLCPFC